MGGRKHLNALYWAHARSIGCGGLEVNDPGSDCLPDPSLHPAWPVRGGHGACSLCVCQKFLSLLYARSEQPHAQLVFTLQQLKLPATLHSTPVPSGSAVLLPPDVR